MSRKDFGRGCGSQFLAENARRLLPALQRFNDSFHDGNPRSRRSISKRFPRLFIVTRGSPRVRLPTMANLAKRVFHPLRVLKIFYSFEERVEERNETSVYRKCYGILLHDFKRNVISLHDSRIQR